ncbi:MAG: hypothetical protein M1815_003063 [Lichina confinis]|nr:MAG: hypothetical protein M1815_003063 [Lichina confinis]
MNPMAQSGAQAVGSQPLPYRQAPGPDHQGRSQDPGHDLGLEADIQSSHAANFSESLSSMSESDRYGLDGLLHMIRNEGSDVGAIAIGQDLTALGLDLSQPDHRPLYQTFASPFAEPGSRPIEPEFYIPPCYNVHNVRPFHEQVASFADDTLFFIFYSSPRDIMQELAAVELTNRMWRYHKELKQWLTKDEGSEPVRISSTEERGCYIIFDTVTWQRTRREFVLRYEDLEGRLVSITGPAAHQAS